MFRVHYLFWFNYTAPSGEVNGSHKCLSFQKYGIVDPILYCKHLKWYCYGYQNVDFVGKKLMVHLSCSQWTHYGISKHNLGQKTEKR